MSDTHMYHRMLDVPDGDLVVHCGDFTAAGARSDYDDFFAWYAVLPHQHKILVAGNHEKLMSDDDKKKRPRVPHGITYLEDSGPTIEGLRFWGSPRTVGYAWMAFTHRAIDKPERLWVRIPDDTDVLVTHGPPFGILDRNYSGQSRGDVELLKRVQIVKPRLHLFGHVHGENGEIECDGTRFVNAAIGDDEDDPSSRIHVVEL